MKNLKLIALLVIPTLFSTSCSNDDAPVNEEEVITTVTTTLRGGGHPKCERSCSMADCSR